MGEAVGKLYFVDRYGNYHLIAEDVREELCDGHISKFLLDHNFRSYYTRAWKIENTKWFDVGSWSEFFVWEV